MPDTIVEKETPAPEKTSFQDKSANLLGLALCELQYLRRVAKLPKKDRESLEKTISAIEKHLS
ncbi:MAG: hypothetical protein KGL39_33155 [Patescibacteria group bacterium]|nr:hypothetical protein [Patescibacteria group bacterium]